MGMRRVERYILGEIGKNLHLGIPPRAAVKGYQMNNPGLLNVL